MSAAGRMLRRTETGYMFWCSGCDSAHAVTTDGSPAWSFNGDLVKPTFSPSVLVLCGRRVVASFQPEPGDPPECCHSFVTDGRIQYLSDCTHALAGQTIDLPDWPA